MIGGMVSIGVGVLLLFFAVASAINRAYARCEQLERRAREDRVALGALLDTLDDESAWRQGGGLRGIRERVEGRAAVRLQRGWDEPLSRGGA